MGRHGKHQKKDNRGFSLIELIIVMVIMAVLVGIVGMQVIPYIAKAHKSKDIQKISSYCTDAVTAYTACAASLDETETYTIQAVKGAAGWTVSTKDSSGNSCSLLNEEFISLNNIDTDAPEFFSKEGQKIDKINIVCKNTKPSIYLTVEGPEHPDEFTVDAK